MKKNVYIAFFLLLSLVGNAQNNTGFYLVNFRSEPESVLSKSTELSDLYYAKLLTIIGGTNGVILDERSDFYIASKMYVSSVNSSNAGFLPVYKCTVNLILDLKFTKNGNSFKQISFQKGYIGNSENECVKKFIEEMPITPEIMEVYLGSGFEKISNYYAKNCEYLVSSVKKYQSIGELDKALGLCLSLPEFVQCNLSLADLVKSIYKSISYNYDYKVFVDAQKLVTQERYNEALDLLKRISIYSSFYQESVTASKDINKFLEKQKELRMQKEIEDVKLQTQQYKNELQNSINQTNIQIANEKRESDQNLLQLKLENSREIRQMELRSKENVALYNAASSYLKYINRSSPVRNYNYYIIR
jgi:hypothetical protein